MIGRLDIYFDKVMKAIKSCPLKTTDKHVLMVMYVNTDLSGQHQEANSNTEKLTGYSKSTVARAIKTLVEKDFLLVVEERDEKPTIYRINVDLILSTARQKCSGGKSPESLGK